MSVPQFDAFLGMVEFDPLGAPWEWDWLPLLGFQESGAPATFNAAFAGATHVAGAVCA